MKIKHWDEASQSWVIDGASNASNLELTNPGYLDNQGNSVTIDHGFTRIANKLNQLEQNLAWVYLNGAKGGTGGGGGGGTDTYTISIKEGSSIYTVNNSASFTLTVLGGSSSRSFTVTARNSVTNAVVMTKVMPSLVPVKWNLTNITDTVDLVFSAVDSVANYAAPAFLSVVVGALELTSSNPETQIIYTGTVGDIMVNYNLDSSLSVSSNFTLTINGIVIYTIPNVDT